MNNICQYRGNHLKKDIYIIKNRINNKVYIGQAKNPEERFISHCKPSSAKLSNSLIDYAIQNIHAVNDFLMQDVDEKFTYEEVLEALKQLFPEDEQEMFLWQNLYIKCKMYQI